MSNKATQRLSENVALICLDQQYQKVEDLALFVLTDIMKQFALEVGEDMKRNAETGMRSEPNLVDALNTSLEHGYTK
eukprot:CAMPEP_0168608884 /NCGR_PEP_ID=MMETSP0449_2-20121227/892_1 /TAXON_ID=1082188 /ORGANISM="Strombidium rassoulzadegani, Strain ras09" /LENGTH=76 /DNA_ID=CAMNT_0008648953 /DNA_START=82 /DNA_END=312 /DNA_ORIENTATION=+